MVIPMSCHDEEVDYCREYLMLNLILYICVCVCVCMCVCARVCVRVIYKSYIIILKLLIHACYHFSQ